MESKIGNKVKKLRLSLGMSQEEFGKKTRLYIKIIY